MVPGIDSFREKFKDYSDYYTIIGGTACDILLSEADLPFQATKDIDMILIMEDNFPEFTAIFWEYIKEGGYKCGWENEENMHFYASQKANSVILLRLSYFQESRDIILK